MYRILFIETGQYVCFFDPQSIPEAKSKNWGAHHRRPPQFWLCKPHDIISRTLISDTVIYRLTHGNSIKMYKRLLEGVAQSYLRERLNIDTISLSLDEFDIQKVEE